MPTLTNISGSHRALPLINKKHVEFARGETKAFPDADWAAIKNRTSVQAHFKVEEYVPQIVVAVPAVEKQPEPAEAPASDAPAPKPVRAKKA
jgi:hypothetical protein